MAADTWRTGHLLAVNDGHFGGWWYVLPVMTLVTVREG